MVAATGYSVHKPHYGIVNQSIMCKRALVFNATIKGTPQVIVGFNL